MSETNTLNRRRWRTVVRRVLAPVLGGLLAASAVAAPAPAVVPDNTVLELFAGASEPLTPTAAAKAACGDRVDNRTFPPTGLPAGSFAQVVIQGTVRRTIPAVTNGSSQTQVNRVVCWNIGGTWVLASDGYRPPRVSAEIPLVVGTTVLRAVTTRNAVTGPDSLTAERVVHRGNRPRAAKDDLSFIFSGALGALTADTATVGGFDFAVDANSEIDPGLAAGDAVSVQYLPAALIVAD